MDQVGGSDVKWDMLQHCPNSESGEQKTELDQIIFLESTQLALLVRQLVLPLWIPPNTEEAETKGQSHETLHQIQALLIQGSSAKALRQLHSVNVQAWLYL